MRKILPIFLIAFVAVLGVTLPVKADSASGTTFTVTKTATPSTVGPSAAVNFTISIKNISAANAAPTEVTDTLPAGFVYNNDSKLTDLQGTQILCSATSTTSFCPTVSGQTITWTFDGTTLQSIPQNQNIVLSFTANAPATVGTYTNTACLTQPENICANATITVQAGTPQAGIIQNIATVVIIGTLLIVMGMKISHKKKSFEDSLIK